MSRVGRKPIPLPSGVSVEPRKDSLNIKGPKGELDVPIHPTLSVAVEDGSVAISPVSEDRKVNALWGLGRSLVDNAIQGVTTGFEKRLVIVGIGYRADLEGTNLRLLLGFSHPVVVPPREGIEFTTEPSTSGVEDAQATVVVKGIDKQLVGQTAAEVRKLRPPEPYKGKGIRYLNEHVRRKAGKTAA